MVITQKCPQKNPQSVYFSLRFISVVKLLFIGMLSLLGYEDARLNYLKTFKKYFDRLHFVYITTIRLWSIICLR